MGIMYINDTGNIAEIHQIINIMYIRNNDVNLTIYYYGNKLSHNIAICVWNVCCMLYYQNVYQKFIDTKNYYNIYYNILMGIGLLHTRDYCNIYYNILNWHGLPYIRNKCDIYYNIGKW